MTQEETVRNAVRVANELVDLARMPDGFGYRMWESVFAAMLYAPIDNRTALGVASVVEPEREQK